MIGNVLNTGLHDLEPAGHVNISTPMAYSLFSPAATEISEIPIAQLSQTVLAYQKDLQTGVVELNFEDQASYHLLFVRGELINVYRHQYSIKRLDPSIWMNFLDNSSTSVSLRALALTPQAIRLVKILLEQKDARLEPLEAGISLEKKFELWRRHSAPALAHLSWPNAEALTLLPGDNTPPVYTLFISSNQILHSAGGMMALYGWKESRVLVSLLGSEVKTPAWEEYLLYYSFTWLVNYLSQRLIELVGPSAFNTITREVNFTAASHAWNISISNRNVIDQSVFSSPVEAANTYSRLFEIIFRQVETALDADLPPILLRESALRLPAPFRTVLQEYLLITPA